MSGKADWEQGAFKTEQPRYTGEGAPSPATVSCSGVHTPTVEHILLCGLTTFEMMDGKCQAEGTH